LPAAADLGARDGGQGGPTVARHGEENGSASGSGRRMVRGGDQHWGGGRHRGGVGDGRPAAPGQAAAPRVQDGAGWPWWRAAAAQRVACSGGVFRRRSFEVGTIGHVGREK
jgi:hypothetical protein